MASTQRFSGPLIQAGRLWVVAVPADAAVSLGSPGHAPVAGTANGTGVHCVITMDGSSKFRILLNAEARRRIGVSGGETVDFVLARDPTRTAPPLPDDLANALDAIDGSRARWDALAAAHRRELLTWIAEAKGVTNRSRRIARTIGKVWE